MTAIEFLNKLNQLDFDTKAIFTLLRSFVSQYSDEPKAKLSNDVRLFFESVAEEKFSEMRTKLNDCMTECGEELKNVRLLEDTDYFIKVKKVKDLLQYIDSIYKNVAQKKYQKPYNISSTVEQHESNLDEIKGRINDLNSDIKTANKLIDDKIFTLLINTVAILGIFVAIAFTGLGTMSIFSNIDLKTAIGSTEAFIKNVFFILLVSTMVYNLLILLVYFIFKLSRPIAKTNDEALSNKTFNQTINLNRFFWVDGALALLTVAAFVASLMVK